MVVPPPIADVVILGVGMGVAAGEDERNKGGGLTIALIITLPIVVVIVVVVMGGDVGMDVGIDMGMDVEVVGTLSRTASCCIACKKGCDCYSKTKLNITRMMPSMTKQAPQPLLPASH